MSTGNLLRYFFGNAVYHMSASESRRARAALALGRSHSPLAVEQLAQAMHDASPEVRREAAHALGESGSRDAVEHLLGELSDRSSDIRGRSGRGPRPARFPRGPRFSDRLPFRRGSPGSHQRHPRPGRNQGGRGAGYAVLAPDERVRAADLSHPGRRPRGHGGPPHRHAGAAPAGPVPLAGDPSAAAQRRRQRPRGARPVLQARLL